MMVTVTTNHLEMHSRSELIPSARAHEPVRVERVEVPCPEYNRFLYTAVGGMWHWSDLLSWPYSRWSDYVNRPELETWVGYVSGTPAGYFELVRQPEGNVEIVHFGLLPQFIGRGIGGVLLTRAIERAWDMGASRVWVHTCSLDGPNALANYRSRGFKLFKTETREVDLPDSPPGPWPGAAR